MNGECHRHMRTGAHGSSWDRHWTTLSTACTHMCLLVKELLQVNHINTLLLSSEKRLSKSVDICVKRFGVRRESGTEYRNTEL